MEEHNTNDEDWLRSYSESPLPFLDTTHLTTTDYEDIQGQETMIHSVLVSPSTGSRTMVTLPDPTNFTSSETTTKHGNVRHINVLGKNNDEHRQGNTVVLKSSSVCLAKSPPSMLASPPSSLHGSTTSTASDRTNTRVKFKTKLDPYVFQDFPTNGVCLKHRGKRGITQDYRDRRKTLFRRMKSGRTKSGELFPNEWIQKEIIEYLTTSLELFEIRFFAIVDGALIEYLTDDEIFDAIRADFGNNTDNYSVNNSISTGRIEDNAVKGVSIHGKATTHPPVKSLGNLLQSNQIELDTAMDMDPGKKKIYQGVMQRIYYAFAGRILDDDSEAELYDWCEWSFTYLFRHEIPEDGDHVTKLSSATAWMESKRLLLKQRAGNPCKIMIFEGILNDIGYAAYNGLLSFSTKAQLHDWVEMTWKSFFEHGADKKRKDPPIFVPDLDDSSNGHDHNLAARTNESNITSPLTSTATTNNSNITKSGATSTTSSSRNTVSSGTSEPPDGRICIGRNAITHTPFALPDGRIMDAKNTLQSFVDVPMSSQRLTMDAANAKLPILKGLEETQSLQQLSNLNEVTNSPQNAVLLSQSISCGSYGTNHSERTNAMHTVASNSTPLSHTDLTDGTDDVIHAHAVVVHSVIVAEGDVLKEPSQVTMQEPTQRLKSDFRRYYCWFRGVWWRLKRKCTATVLKRSK